MMVKDVFFDLDHTLWDFEKNSALAMEKVFDEENISISYSDFLKIYSPINFNYWELYRKDQVTQKQLRYGRLKDSFDAMDFQIDDATIEILSTKYIDYLPTFNHLFDGALDLLQYLAPKYRLHIITNGFDTVQNMKLTNSGIIQYFHTITNSENAGHKKPNPVIFEYALNAAKASKASSIMIGDCIDADVRGALNFGMDAILFCEKDLEYDNIKKVKTLTELKNIL